MSHVKFVMEKVIEGVKLAMGLVDRIYHILRLLIMGNVQIVVVLGSTKKNVMFVMAKER